MTRTEIFLQEILPGFFPWLWGLLWTLATWALYVILVVVALGILTEFLAYLWRQVSEEGKIIPEKRLPYGFYRVLEVMECDTYQVAIVTSSKGELIACKSEAGKAFEAFTLVGHHPNQFLVPREKEQAVKSGLGFVP